MEIRRCQHIKTNGVQCGSPALRSRAFCYFHVSWGHHQPLIINEARTNPMPGALNLPVLEDYESVQMAIMQVLGRLTTGHLDSKTAGLLLYGLQIASSNLRYARFDPRAESVVIDPTTTHLTPLDGDQWSEEDENDEDYDGEEQEEDDDSDDEEGGDEGDEEDLNDELADDAEVKSEELKAAEEKQRARELRWKARDEQVTKKFKGRPSELEMRYRLEHGMAIPDRLCDSTTQCGAGIPARDVGADAPVRPQAKRVATQPARDTSPLKTQEEEQPRISDAQFFQAMANFVDHVENGTPLKFPVYPASPPASLDSEKNGKRKGRNGSS